MNTKHDLSIPSSLSPSTEPVSVDPPTSIIAIDSLVLGRSDHTGIRFGDFMRMVRPTPSEFAPWQLNDETNSLIADLSWSWGSLRAVAVASKGWTQIRSFVRLNGFRSAAAAFLDQTGLDVSPTRESLAYGRRTRRSGGAGKDNYLPLKHYDVAQHVFADHTQLLADLYYDKALSQVEWLLGILGLPLNPDAPGFLYRAEVARDQPRSRFVELPTGGYALFSPDTDPRLTAAMDAVFKGPRGRGHYTTPFGEVMAAGVATDAFTYRVYATEPPDHRDPDADLSMTQLRSESRFKSGQFDCIGGATFASRDELVQKLDALIDFHRDLVARMDDAYRTELPRDLLASILRAELEPHRYAEFVTGLFRLSPTVRRQRLKLLFGNASLKVLEDRGVLVKAGHGKSAIGPTVRQKATAMREKYGDAIWTNPPPVMPEIFDGCVIDQALPPWVYKTVRVYRNRRIFNR